MNCSKVLELVCAFRDNELNDSDRKSVEQHLSQCTACSESLKEHEKIAALLSNLPQYEFPDAARKAIWSSLQGNLQAATSVHPEPRVDPSSASDTSALSSITSSASDQISACQPSRVAGYHSETPAWEP